MTPIVIFGASGHARVIADAIHCCGGFDLLGTLDPGLSTGAEVDGVKVLGDDKAMRELLNQRPNLAAIVGVGDNARREMIVRQVGEHTPSIRFLPIVHPSAVIAADVVVKAGAFVAAGAVVNCGARIGAHAIINTRASVDHDAVVEDFAFIGPGAALAGNVEVGRGAFVGIGACVIQGIRIGEDAVVGAGAAVIHDVAAGATVVGVPARPA